MEKQDFIKWAKKLAENYQPSEQVRAQLANIDLIAIVGPTGVGKTTIMHELRLPEVKSDVTRPVRAEEKKKPPYKFRDDYVHMLEEIKQGQFVQFLVSSSGEFYGTRRDAYPKSGQCVMAIYADQMNNFLKLGFRSVHQFYIMPPGYVEWMRRIQTHGVHDLPLRLTEAGESMNKALEDDKYHFILNDQLERAVSDIQSVLSGGSVDQRRAQLAKDTAGSLLEKLGAAGELL